MIGESRSAPYGGARSPGQIERELARLRTNEEDGSIGARASVLNLIVVTSEESAPEVTRVVCELSGNYPSRAILMVSDPEERASNLEIGLSAYCSVRHGMPGGSRDQVCAEHIMMHVEGPPAEHLESIAGPVLIPDLPVFLWYPDGGVRGSSACDGMAVLVDRLILDSGATSDCEASLRDIAALSVRGGVPPIGDLQWAALSPWRSLLGDLFAPPERAGELAKIRRVEVLHDRTGECQALLLIGWLSGALGWRPQSANDTAERRTFRFDGPSGEVTVELYRDEPEISLRRVRLYSEELSFQVSRYGQRADARSTVMRGEELVGERTVHLGFSGVAELLGEELRFLGRDETHESALKRVVKMLDQ